MIQAAYQEVKVDPAWRPLRDMQSYKMYFTGRYDFVRLANDPFVHTGNLAFVMSGKIWCHTLCGITYAVVPDPLTADGLRSNVHVTKKQPPSGTMECYRCSIWESLDEDGDEAC